MDKPNPFTPTWKEYFQKIEEPRGILVISAHWEGDGLALTNGNNEKSDLSSILYPVKGSLELF